MPHVTPTAYDARNRPRKRRSEAEIIAGICPFDYLCARFGQYRDLGKHDKAQELALELMPYVKPKLKSIDHKLSGSVHVSVRIGGDDTSPDGGIAETTEGDI